MRSAIRVLIVLGVVLLSTRAAEAQQRGDRRGARSGGSVSRRGASSHGTRLPPSLTERRRLDRRGPGLQSAAIRATRSSGASSRDGADRSRSHIADRLGLPPVSASPSAGAVARRTGLRAVVAARRAARAARPAPPRQLVPAMRGRSPQVTSRNPALVMFLLADQARMGLRIVGAPISIAHAVAEVANHRIADLIRANARLGDVIDRAHVSEIRYGERVSRRDPGFESLSNLAEHPARLVPGDANAGEGVTPVWVEAMARGEASPMREAFDQAQQVTRMHRNLRGRLSSGRQPGLVLAIHVASAAPSTGDPRGAVKRLARSVAAAGDQLLVTNVRVRSDSESRRMIAFPTEEQAAAFDADDRMLYEMSSPVPDALLELAHTLNPMIRVTPGGGRPRMMVRDADALTLDRIVAAGTRLATHSDWSGPFAF